MTLRRVYSSTTLLCFAATMSVAALSIPGKALPSGRMSSTEFKLLRVDLVTECREHEVLHPEPSRQTVPQREALRGYRSHDPLLLHRVRTGIPTLWLLRPRMDPSSGASLSRLGRRCVTPNY